MKRVRRFGVSGAARKFNKSPSFICFRLKRQAALLDFSPDIRADRTAAIQTGIPKRRQGRLWIRGGAILGRSVSRPATGLRFLTVLPEVNAIYLYCLQRGLRHCDIKHKQIHPYAPGATAKRGALTDRTGNDNIPMWPPNWLYPIEILKKFNDINPQYV